MAFDRSLIALGKNDKYGLPWLVGTGGIQALTKYCKTDIDSVNIAQTCSSLQLSLQKYQDQESQNSSINAAKESTVIPFRVCSNLLYGTLKIYQQQVNNLYKLSEDLVIRSSKYETASLTNKKNSQKAIKKRRLTITQSNGFLNNSGVNYSQMLDELVEISQVQDVDKVSSDVPSQKRHYSSQFQIREITIREITTTYGIAELDNDDGFGNATNEDIVAFFNCSGCRDSNVFSNTKRTPLKRKSIYDSGINLKETRIGCETPIQCIDSDGNTLNTDFIITPCRPTKDACKDVEQNMFTQNKAIANSHTSFSGKQAQRRKSDYEEDVIASKRNRFDHDSTINNEYSANNDMTNYDLMATPQRLYKNALEGSNNKDIKDNVSIDIKPEIKTELDTSYKENIPMLNIVNGVKNEFDADDKKSTKRFLPIIDQCIKLEEQEMIDQIKKPPKDLRGITKNNFKKSQMKKVHTAKELLKRFNKRTLFFAAKLKEKSLPLDNCKFQQEYLSLVRDILKPYYKEDWAFEIYPKWQKSNAKKKINKKQHQRQQLQQNELITSNEMQLIDENCNYVVFNENLNVANDDDENQKKITPIDGQSMDNILQENLEKSTPSKKWRPSYVMMKLLEIWQYSGAEIDANDFCHSAKNRIDKAMTFASLLTLSKSRFVFITHRQNSIEMDKILLGKAAKKIMNEKKKKI
ncbi:crossover suppressor on 2 of Manheim isoform X2 [Musca autumnalis]|uniref:crossover suppressor on 2 of Manheim isoform X2 n=1 Tax=Musca autumnalis TaxID=221902 RepID=UPI003CECE7C0